MRSFFTFLLGLLPVLLSGMDPATLRSRFRSVALDQACAQTFLEDLGRAPSGALVRAYEAATTALLAKSTWNPYTKVEHCRTSAILFRSAILLQPENPEIRYLRLAVQLNLPKFLSMSGDIEEDRSVILANLSSADPAVRHDIAAFLLEHKLCDRNQLACCLP
jgi:hypothetical protein